METQKKKRKPMKQGYKILLGVAIGALIGILFGEKATILKPIGTIYLNLMYCSLIPLVFFSISSSVANLKSPNMLGKMLASVFGVFITTGAIAALIMITLVNVFSYASGIVVDSFEPATASDAFSLSNQLVNMFTVSDFPELLSRSHILPLIVFAIIFGVAATTCGESGRAVAKALNAGSDVAFRIIGMLMKIAPIGLGAYFANLIATYGPKLLGNYLYGIVRYYPTLFLYFIIFYTLYVYWAAGPQGVKLYFKNISTPALVAFGTQSSAATIPVNREACRNIGVPDEVSSVVIPMGATCHMDGSAMSAIFRIVVVAHIFGMPLEGFATWGMVLLVAIFGSVANSAVPGGGGVMAAIIVSVFGFPPEALAVILLLGNLGDPITTMTNAAGDTGAAMMVSRLLYGKDWLTKARAAKETESAAS